MWVPLFGTTQALLQISWQRSLPAWLSPGHSTFCQTQLCETPNCSSQTSMEIETVVGSLAAGWDHAVWHTQCLRKCARKHLHFPTFENLDEYRIWTALLSAHYCCSTPTWYCSAPIPCSTTTMITGCRMEKARRGSLLSQGSGLCFEQSVIKIANRMLINSTASMFVEGAVVTCPPQENRGPVSQSNESY